MLESIVTAYKDFTQNKIPGIVETKMKLCGVLDVVIFLVFVPFA